jgi:hypothetical protein
MGDEEDETARRRDGETVRSTVATDDRRPTIDDSYGRLFPQ